MRQLNGNVARVLEVQQGRRKVARVVAEARHRWAAAETVLGADGVDAVPGKGLGARGGGDVVLADRVGVVPVDWRGIVSIVSGVKEWWFYSHFSPHEYGMVELARSQVRPTLVSSKSRKLNVAMARPLRRTMRLSCWGAPATRERPPAAKRRVEVHMVMARLWGGVWGRKRE